MIIYVLRKLSIIAHVLGVLHHQAILCLYVQQAVQQAKPPHLLLRDFLYWERVSNFPGRIPLNIGHACHLPQVSEVSA